MKRQTMLKKFRYLCLVSFLALSVSTVFAAVVSESEAKMIADSWMAMELNSDYLKIDEGERAERLKGLASGEVMSLTSNAELVEARSSKGRALAYVVKYQPSGYVVVAGDDRLQPVLVFDAQSEFRWDEPEQNFMHYYLSHTMPARWKNMDDQVATGKGPGVHENWSKLRAKLQSNRGLESLTFDAPEANGDIFVVWNTASWSQGPYYNSTVKYYNGGNGAPTGCTATAMAIKFRFHSWPDRGNGAHGYDDVWGELQYSHYVDFSSHDYDWSDMPITSLTDHNQGVAKLMYHCGVAVNMNYELGGSGAWPDADKINTHFRYKGTIQKTSDHEDSIIASLRGGLPTIVSSSAHTVVVDGYRSNTSPFFRVNAGWNSFGDGWYLLEDIPGENPIARSYPYSSPRFYYYVDGSWSGSQNGNIQTPYGTIAAGVQNITDDGWLWIKAGTYNGSTTVPNTYDRPMLIRTYEGNVVINGSIKITEEGRIGLMQDGQIKIY